MKEIRLFLAMYTDLRIRNKWNNFVPEVIGIDATCDIKIMVIFILSEAQSVVQDN